MMLCNMALVWFMIYFSICLMIIISICFMIIVSREYFEITFISRKKDCADRPFEITYFSISGQHNLWKQFLMLLGLRWLLTFVYKWGVQNFRPQNYFRHKNIKDFIDEKTHFIYFFVHSFLRKALCPYPCVEIKFWRKETVCYVRF